MGGLAGHMMHPHDNLDLKIGQFVDLCVESLRGDYDFMEKLDGFNVHILKYNGQLRFARNAADLVDGGFNKQDMDARFSNERVRGIYKWAWDEVMRYESVYLNSLPDFIDDAITLNAEIIFEKTNIIRYSIHKVIPHNFYQWTYVNGKYNLSSIEKISGHPGIRVRYSPKPYDYALIAEDTYRFFERWGLTRENTLRDYYHVKFLDVLRETGYLDLINPQQYAGIRALFNRFFKDGPQTNLRQIRKMFAVNIDEVLADEKIIVRETKSNLDCLVLSVGTQILQNTRGINADHDYEVRAELERELRTCKMDPIQRGRWELTGSNIFSLEGVVFESNGVMYKWTGPFAPINQILGGNR